MTVSKRTLKELRETRQLSLERVAADLEISERTIRRHEDGTTPLRLIHLKAYADYYGVAPEEIAA